MTRRPKNPLRKPLEVWDGRKPVPQERFGSDHWHLLLHLRERRAVRRTRWQDGPTLLVDAELYGHTDLDVLLDLAAAGLVRSFDEQVRMTPRGHVTEAELCAHLAVGGNYVNFRVDVVSVRLAS